MKKNLILPAILCSLILVACNSKAFPAPVLTATESIDPCAPDNLPASVQKVNNVSREFDDASQLAFNLQKEQLPGLISNMQRIRRDAENLPTLSCLATIRTHQLNYMNITINTLIAFVGGADQKFLTSELARAKQEHDLYTLEIMKTLGVTLAPVTTTPAPPASTSTPISTP